MIDTPNLIGAGVYVLKVQHKRPIGGLMDRRFVYIPAASTDIRATFARVKANNPLPLKGLK